MASRTAPIVLGALLILVAAPRHSGPEAATIAVRYAEGVTHGLLLVRSRDGQVVAHGDLLQVARTEDVPAFVRYDGALYPTGPVLRTELVNAR